MLRPLFTEAVLHALEEANRVIISRDGPNRMGTTSPDWPGSSPSAVTA